MAPALLLTMQEQQPNRIEKRMSAVKDQSQNSTFIYTNFYNLYRKSQFDSKAKDQPVSGVLLKTLTHTAVPESLSVQVINEEQQVAMKNWTTLSLRSNYRTLRESRKKLKFLMSEVEEILART
jgi:hypothetical protein